MAVDPSGWDSGAGARTVYITPPMQERSPTAAIVVIGDEILSCKFSEENASYLISALRELGVALRRIEVIPDVIDDIRDTVRACSGRFDHVFTSGGVGPTHDDLTMAGIAAAFGVRVVRHATLEALLRAFYGDQLVERNLRMADVPEDAELLPTEHASWPVVQARNVTILPGVPIIFRRKFDAIRERFRATPFFVKRVFCMADEGALAAHLDAVVAGHPRVSVGSYPRMNAADHRVIVTLESIDSTAVTAATREFIESLPAGTLVRIE